MARGPSASAQRWQGVNRPGSYLCSHECIRGDKKKKFLTSVIQKLIPGQSDGLPGGNIVRFLH